MSTLGERLQLRPLSEPVDRPTAMASMTKARALKIGVVDADSERTRLRAELDRFEERYQVPSERLAEAFTGPDGQLDESDDFHAWGKAWASYQILTGR